MAGPNTNQHYLPQAYLKRWGTEGKKKRFLVPAFNRKTGIAKAIITDQVCFERGFLDYVNAAGVIISVDESWLPIENAALLTLKKLCSNPTGLMLEEQKADLANMVAFFLLNSASVRQNLSNALEDFNLKAPWFQIDEDRNALKQRHLTLVPKMMPDLSTALLQMEWTLVRPGSKLKFWTSDFPFAFGAMDRIPVTVTRKVDEKETTLELSPELLRRPDVTMWFPLSPDVGLFFGDRPDYLSIPEGSRINYTTTEELNTWEVFSGQQFIFAKDLDFGRVEKLAKRYAEVLSPGQPRSWVQSIHFDPPPITVEVGPEKVNPAHLEWLEREGRREEAQELRAKYGLD